MRVAKVMGRCKGDWGGVTVIRKCDNLHGVVTGTEKVVLVDREV